MAALAVVAPDLLPKMRADVDKAFNRAAEQDSFTPVRAFLLHWAAIVEIERFPETARTYRRSLYLAQQLGKEREEEEDVREYLAAAGDILRAATRAVQE